MNEAALLAQPAAAKPAAGDWAAIYKAAKAAAVAAVEANKGLENPNAFDCGFGWVEVRDGRSPFVNWCRKNGAGKKHWSKGWYFWGPGEHYGQSIAVHQKGADAFAAVLNANGVEASSCSRYD